uniref:F-box domain-containing protein n=1 Tax=Oryza sativa subsp. japonica TaxID=39947 RepID=Q6K2D6_ORYSJ|nr:hypothetical protein [Oryza sativa Japonica Group]
MDLPDDLVELILLRLASTVYLIRAASTCKQWRRIVAAADAGFLRRFRSLHAPAIAGYYYNSEKFTSFAPSSPSASASAPAIDDSHFSLDFLQVIVQDIVDGSRPQSSSSWRIMDSRGSLLLLDFAGSHPDDGVRSLLVCEPLTRRYQWVVPPSAGRGFGGGGCEFSRAYLADGAEADEAGGRVGMSNFRVVYELYHHHHGVSAAVFTFTTGGGAQLSWEEKAIGNIAGSSSCMHVLGHAGGSCTAEYSASESELPLEADNWLCWDVMIFFPSCFRVAEGRDGHPRILTVVPGGGALKVFARCDNGGGEWVEEKMIPCAAAMHRLLGRPASSSSLGQWMSIVTTRPGFAVVSPQVREGRWFFAVDLDTMETPRATEQVQTKSKGVVGAGRGVVGAGGAGGVGGGVLDGSALGAGGVCMVASTTRYKSFSPVGSNEIDGSNCMYRQKIIILE